MPDSLLIGLRNPVPEGRALVIPLLNPFEVIDDGNARIAGQRCKELADPTHRRFQALRVPY